MRVDECGGGGYGFDEKVPMIPVDVVAVLPQVQLTHEGLRKFGSVVAGISKGGKVKGEDVGIAGDKEGRGLEEDDVVEGDKLFKVVKYFSL